MPILRRVDVMGNVLYSLELEKLSSARRSEASMCFTVTVHAFAGTGCESVFGAQR